MRPVRRELEAVGGRTSALAAAAAIPRDGTIEREGAFERSIAPSTRPASMAAIDLSLNVVSHGKLTWRTVLAWLRDDKIAEPGRHRAHGAPLRRRQQRRSTRWCASAAPNLKRVGDGKILDVETLTEWLAKRSQAALHAHRSAQGRRRPRRRRDVDPVRRAAPRLAAHLRPDRRDDRDLRAARRRLGAARSRRTRAATSSW